MTIRTSVTVDSLKHDHNDYDETKENDICLIDQTTRSTKMTICTSVTVDTIKHDGRVYDEKKEAQNCLDDQKTRISTPSSTSTLSSSISSSSSSSSSSRLERRKSTYVSGAEGDEVAMALGEALDKCADAIDDILEEIYKDDSDDDSDDDDDDDDDDYDPPPPPLSDEYDDDSDDGLFSDYRAALASETKEEAKKMDIEQRANISISDVKHPNQQPWEGRIQQSTCNSNTSDNSNILNTDKDTNSFAQSDNIEKVRKQTKKRRQQKIRAAVAAAGAVGLVVASPVGITAVGVGLAAAGGAILAKKSAKKIRNRIKKQ